MIVTKQKTNHLIKIDRTYISDFSYVNVGNKLEEVKKEFSEDEILDYFLSRSGLDTADLTMMKYVYPILLLNVKTIYNNAEKVINSLSDEQFLWIYGNFKHKIVDVLMVEYLTKKLSGYKNLSIELSRYKTNEWEDFFRSIDNYLSKYCAITEVQNIIFDMYKHVMSLDTDIKDESTKYTLNKISKYIRNKEGDGFQSFAKYLLLETDCNIEALRILLEYATTSYSQGLVTDVTLYLNSLNEASERDCFIMHLFSEKATQFCYHLIDWDKWISFAKKQGLWKWAIQVDLAMKNENATTKQAYEYCEEVLNLLLDNKIADEVGNIKYRFFNIFKKLNNKELNEKMHHFFRINLNRFKQYYDSKKDSYIDLIDLIDVNADNQDEKYEILSEIVLATSSKSIISKLEKNLKNLEKISLLAAEKVLMLKTKKDETSISIIKMLMQFIDVATQEDIINELIESKNEEIRKICNQKLFNYHFRVEEK